MIKFYCDYSLDKRLAYASEYLNKQGIIPCKNYENADFTLLGVNPKDYLKYNSKPVLAGNVCGLNVFDYTKDEIYASTNAFLTCEAALAIAVENSDCSLLNSKILIIGYGRIASKLHQILKSFSNDITVCVRNKIARNSAYINGAKTIEFCDLANENDFSFVFNTVPHPVLNEYELKALPNDALVIDLASFPGGADMHFAKKLEKNIIVARGLPGKYSPKTAGEIVAKSVINLLEKGDVFI